MDGVKKSCFQTGAATHGDEVRAVNTEFRLSFPGHSILNHQQTPVFAQTQVAQSFESSLRWMINSGDNILRATPAESLTVTGTRGRQSLNPYRLCQAGC
jgi:hypothetical protein